VRSSSCSRRTGSFEGAVPSLHGLRKSA
jgi:hypothetical protein